MSGAFYNEIDPAACAVLRELIINGVIAPGVVDSRPIQEVRPDDVRGFSQVHLFAGGGLWSVAARLAGWPDDRPLWTGSCPCQPFSQAGKGAGRDDPRHLWPDMFRLVRACRPACVVGEQVAGKAGLDWFDGVAADLGGEDYACRAVDIPAASVDAPHIRQRLYWVAMADADCCGRRGRAQDAQRGALSRVAAEWTDGASVGVTLGDAERAGLEGQRRNGDAAARRAATPGSTSAADGCGVVDAQGVGWREGRAEHELQRGRDAVAGADAPQRRNSSFWSGSEWIICHDGKARRAQPGVRLLVDGLPGRVGLWRIAGNAIVPTLAAEVLAALMETGDERSAA